ncbi:hypothetical protein HPP92_009584 [Vanilla planifolia]|uniref:Rit1 DUSP-like domain-containing protein n=1 Tax=Vanilla planifolia TaxID=51239 RepID=A0A835RAJ8_VANPL|nr:hypothetical protein HPP92_009584 [Vanilla planifolia]
MTAESSNEEHALYWIGSTTLAVGRTVDVMNSFGNAGCILNCDPKFISSYPTQDDSYLHLPIVCSKLDRFSLRNSLRPASNFARLNLKRGKKLLICCHNGEDISICTSLAILTALFNEEGTFDDGKSYMSTSLTKCDLRRRLVFICKYVVNARPSRACTQEPYESKLSLRKLNLGQPKT